MNGGGGGRKESWSRAGLCWPVMIATRIAVGIIQVQVVKMGINETGLFPELLITLQSTRMPPKATG